MNTTNDRNGKVYNITNDRNRAIVGSYHSTARNGFCDHHKGAKQVDIRMLKTAQKKNFITDENNDIQAKFTLGIEVEKNRFSRNAVKEYPLFAGYEEDSSCGVEAVTNILPLLPKGKWRNKVFNMMFEAKSIIESPSDYRCGGHMTMGVDGLTGAELRDKIRKNAGIVLALFRHRLKNRYCNSNLTMVSEDNRDLLMNGSGRYQVLLTKSNTVEFRLVARFDNVKQMMRRYELMYELLDFSVNNPNGKFKTFLNKVKPIVKSMYGGDEDKTNEILELAKAFQKMINTNRTNAQVSPYLSECYIPQSMQG